MKSSNIEALLGACLLIVAFSLGTFACNTQVTSTVKSVPSFSGSIVTPAAQTPASKNITRLELPQDRTVVIYGEINEGNEQTVQQLLSLGKTEEPIYVVLKSPGGSVLDGAMIISAMEAAKGPVYTICDTLCASMAAMIFEHGKSRYMVDRSFVMFHPASGGAQGEVDKMVSRMTSVQKFMNKMEAYVANRANITFEKYKQLASVELWIDGEDAVNTGFADGLVAYTLPTAFVPPQQNQGSNLTRNLSVPGFSLEPMKRTLKLTWKVE